MKKFMVGLLALFFIAQGALAGASISLSLCNANLNQVAIAFSSSRTSIAAAELSSIPFLVSVDVGVKQYEQSNCSLETVISLSGMYRNSSILENENGFLSLLLGGRGQIKVKNSFFFGEILFGCGLVFSTDTASYGSASIEKALVLNLMTKLKLGFGMDFGDGFSIEASGGIMPYQLPVYNKLWDEDGSSFSSFNVGILGIPSTFESSIRYAF